MSALDQLKNGSSVVIDTTTGDGVVESGEENITPGTPSRAKQIVTQQEAPTSNNRIVVNATDIIDDSANSKEDSSSPTDAADKIAKSIFEKDNMLEKYLENERREAEEWMASRKEEEELKAEEDEIDDLADEIGSGSLVMSGIDNQSNDSVNYDFASDDDITSSLDDDDEEEIVDQPVEEAIEVPEEITATDIDMKSNTVYDADPIEEEEDDEEDETPNSETAEDVDNNTLEHLKKQATERLKPISKKLDISSFTVAKQPSNNVTSIFNAQKSKVSKWVLPLQESAIFMKEFSGAELESMREYSENSRSLDSLNRRFHMLYDHIVSPKPASFETWLKSTPYDDVDHLFFAVYIASFKGANFLPEDCVNDKCKEAFITDDIDIMQMVKFDTKEAKDKFKKIYDSEPTISNKGVFVTEVVPISNTVAIGFKQPSIYDVFEITSLSQDITSKYSTIIPYIPYIDEIYMIDIESKQLIPVGYKKYNDNAQKTVRSKLNKYSKIFNTLTIDEFGPIKAYVRDISEKNSGIRYVYPSVECPKCKTATNEVNATAEELVFTRYQLGALTSTSLN